MEDLTSVKSCTGYIITIGGMSPVIWSSKLQTGNALFTCEAEFIAVMRALLPLRELLQSLTGSLNIEHDDIMKVCAIWEDNKITMWP